MKITRLVLITVFAWAGMMGPVLFWVLLLVAQALHPGYDAWEDSVSRLTFAPFGWVQIVNFYALATFSAAFGVTGYLAIARSALGRVGSVLLMIVGAAQLLLVVFPVDVNPFGPKSLSYSLHNAVFVISAASFPFGAGFLLPDLISDERWQPLAFFTIGIVAAVLALEVGRQIAASISPHIIDPWFGFYERLLFSLPLAWMMVISGRLLCLYKRLK